MFSRVNIEEELTKFRNKRIEEQDIMNEVFELLSVNDSERQEICSVLKGKQIEKEHSFDFDLLESSRIFHEDDIKKICSVYRLRFLKSHYFKGGFPEEAISEIRNLENLHQTKLSNFKIVAPAKMLKLESADDPLLFAPIGNVYYYLIYKWGNDLNPWRKLMMWPFKSMVNLVITTTLMSALLTVLAPMHWFSENPGNGEYIFLFLIIFKGIIGLTAFYGIAFGKNFNNNVWTSKYYNG